MPRNTLAPLHYALDLPRSTYQRLAQVLRLVGTGKLQRARLREAAGLVQALVAEIQAADVSRNPLDPAQMCLSALREAVEHLHHADQAADCIAYLERGRAATTLAYARMHAERWYTGEAVESGVSQP